MPTSALTLGTRISAASEGATVSLSGGGERWPVSLTPGGVAGGGVDSGVSTLGQPKRPRRALPTPVAAASVASACAGGCADALGAAQPQSANTECCGSGVTASSSEPHAEASETARALRSRAQDLARRARERKLETKKVLTLLVCRGAYCWNPLKVDKDDGQEASTWADVESALSFLESRDEEAAQSSSIYNHLLPHHLHALAGGPPTAATAAAAAAAAAATAAGGVATAAVAGGIVAGGFSFSIPPPVHLPATAAAISGGGVSGRGQLLFHLFCLAQRGEELRFVPRIELFWSNILEAVLPRSSDAEML